MQIDRGYYSGKYSVYAFYTREVEFLSTIPLIPPLAIYQLEQLFFRERLLQYPTLPADSRAYSFFKAIRRSVKDSEQALKPLSTSLKYCGD